MIGAVTEPYCHSQASNPYFCHELSDIIVCSATDNADIPDSTVKQCLGPSKVSRSTIVDVCTSVIWKIN